MTSSKINRWLESRAYKKARTLVSGIVSSPNKLLTLVAAAQSKFASKQDKSLRGQIGKFGELFESTSAALRLLKAYAAGVYRDISVESLALIVASIIYFVMPIDALPDFILALGLSDDAALLAWTLRSVSDEIDKFTKWEAEQPFADSEADASSAFKPNAEENPEPVNLPDEPNNGAG